MRIIAGEAGGRKLKSRKTSEVRPTLDRVKEAVFNMLNPYIHDTEVIDLFAGFGNLGLEALSRGAQKSIFIEKDYRNGKIIRENIKLCNFEDRSELIIDDVFSHLPKIDDRFDIIFMDPPYNKGYCQRTLNLLCEESILIKNGSLVVVEHSKTAGLSNLNKLYKIKEKEYGDTSITIFEVREVK